MNNKYTGSFKPNLTLQSLLLFTVFLRTSDSKKILRASLTTNIEGPIIIIAIERALVLLVEFR